MYEAVRRPSTFFFNDTATTEIYTLSLHDALPISRNRSFAQISTILHNFVARPSNQKSKDRKSTRLNSSHSQISYAVFCLKKKNNYCLTNISNHITIVFISPLPVTIHTALVE